MAISTRASTSGRVLVAEDDPDMRSLIVEVLTRAGHEVHAVNDGVALLLELAREGGFRHDSVDVVVSDIRMPFCSGLRVLETLHAVRPDLPVILLTAFGTAELCARARQLGGVLLDKPLGMAELCRLVAERVQSRRALPRS